MDFRDKLTELSDEWVRMKKKGATKSDFYGADKYRERLRDVKIEIGNVVLGEANTYITENERIFYNDIMRLDNGN